MGLGFYLFFKVSNALFILLVSATNESINTGRGGGWRKHSPDFIYLLSSLSKTNTDKCKFKTQFRFMRFPEQTRLNVLGRSSAIDLHFGHVFLHNFQTVGHLLIISVSSDVSRSTNLSLPGISHFLSLAFQTAIFFLSVL